MMFINGLLYKVNKEKMRRGRIQAAHHIAVGMSVVVVTGVCVALGIFLNTKSGKELREKMKNKAIDTVEDVKNIVIKGADAVEVSAAYTADKVSHAIETAHDKAEDIKKELRDGSNDIKNDVHETAENISKAFKE